MGRDTVATIPATSAKRRPGRPPHRREELVAAFSRQILSGQWLPGQKIPTQLELEATFGAANPTVQDALDVLTRHGFLVARGSRGTFVVPHPPHLCRYGLVFPDAPSSHWSRLYQALTVAAQQLTRTDGPEVREFLYFHAINGHVDTADYQRLLASVEAQCLAGLVFANAPFNLTQSPVLMAPGLPRVAVASAINPLYPQVLARYVDLDSFLTRAMAFLASPAGGQRRRLAVICYGLAADRVAQFQQAAAAHQITLHPWQVQTPDLSSPLAIDHAARLLLSGPADTRPDALLIADDNYVEMATHGVAAMGLVAPRDLTVVAMTNFPCAPPAAVAVTRLGFDARALLASCVAAIDGMRRGQPGIPEQLLPAVFADELPGAS